MARVVLSENGAMEFAKNLRELNDDDKFALRYWLDFVKQNGILKAQDNPSFKDHELIGKYRILDSKIEIVEIERITISHNYQR